MRPSYHQFPFLSHRTPRTHFISFLLHARNDISHHHVCCTCRKAKALSQHRQRSRHQIPQPPISSVVSHSSNPVVPRPLQPNGPKHHAQRQNGTGMSDSATSANLRIRELQFNEKHLEEEPVQPQWRGQEDPDQGRANGALRDAD